MKFSPRFPKIALIIFFALLVLHASSAVAKGKLNAALYATGNADSPALLYNDSGIIFLGRDLAPFRVFQWKQNKSTPYSQPFYVVDLDGDKQVEFIGVGKPTFMLSNSADPVWFDPKGCDQLLVDDFTADDKPDLLCLRGTTVRMQTFDNQMVWELNLGRRIDFCRAQDINGDLKSDIECKYAGKKSFVRLDGSSGQVISLESPEEMVTKEYVSEVQPVQAIAADAPPAELSSMDYKGKPLFLLSHDFNGDKVNDSLVITEKEIATKDGTKGKEETLHFSSNTKKYKRLPVASLQDTYVNGFQKDEEAKAVLQSLQEKLAKCYAMYVKKSPFAGSGRLILQTKVDDKGNVSSLQTIYSSLADKKIATCALKEVQKATFGPAKEGAEANVNMTILYSFKNE